MDVCRPTLGLSSLLIRSHCGTVQPVSAIVLLALQLVHEEPMRAGFAHYSVYLVCACTVVGRLNDINAKNSW